MEVENFLVSLFIIPNLNEVQTILINSYFSFLLSKISRK